MILRNSLADTIAAIATPSGFGGIGIIRLSGPKAIEVADHCWVSLKKLKELPDRQLTRGKVLDDQAMAVVMRAPDSYTGEEVVEFHCHGSPVLLQSILTGLFKNGARPAEPGEFTKRAFLNGKLDLVQAEAVADLIASETEKGAELAARQLSGFLSGVIGKIKNDLMVMRAQIEAMIDFPEDEDVQGLYSEEMSGRVEDLKNRVTRLLATFEEGRRFREGVQVVICGRPNVGKSSLLNALLEEDRAIVHPTPGTTRDLVDGAINLNGLPVRFIDTAGIREGLGSIESEGIRRSWEKVRSADLILFLVDRSLPFQEEDFSLYEKIADKKPLIIFNKKDLPAASTASPLTPLLEISAQEKEGIGELKALLYERLIGSSKSSSAELLLTNPRHKNCLGETLLALERVSEGVAQKISFEFLAADLLGAANHLAEITGEITHDEILGEIFARFCLGK
ncbi:MAG: tRNA uridine-5-carboxymethylaminomethyl(34) synthesis GTPase MnmE [Deltaproteobacteria bacterium]|nr:tRNA uridine-5-carboxymethylaminomethyl(34) synthesis GTPase MnmE [Deltaproteobacteria bacterium]